MIAHKSRKPGGFGGLPGNTAADFNSQSHYSRSGILFQALSPSLWSVLTGSLAVDLIISAYLNAPHRTVALCVKGVAL